MFGHQNCGRKWLTSSDIDKCTFLHGGHVKNLVKFGAFVHINLLSCLTIPLDNKFGVYPPPPPPLHSYAKRIDAVLIYSISYILPLCWTFIVSSLLLNGIGYDFLLPVYFKPIIYHYNINWHVLASITFLSSPLSGSDAIVKHANGQSGVVSISLVFPAWQGIDTTVQGLLGHGLTVSVCAGNDNADACNYSPQRVVDVSVQGRINRDTGGLVYPGAIFTLLQ